MLAQGKVVKECVRRKDYIENNRTRLLVDLNPGNYCVQVRAFSKAGPGPPTKETCFLIEVYFAFLSFQKNKQTIFRFIITQIWDVFLLKKETSSGLSGSTISVIFVMVLLFVVLLTGAIVYFVVKSRKNKDDHGIISINPDYHSTSRECWERRKKKEKESNVIRLVFD